MIQAPDLPGWAALMVAVLLIAGAGFTLIGSFGLLRFKSFYERIHPPTIGTTLGALLIITGSMLCFSVLGCRLVVHELLIVLLTAVTTPITFMLLARAALYRDRRAGSDAVPPDAPGNR